VKNKVLIRFNRRTGYVEVLLRCDGGYIEYNFVINFKRKSNKRFRLSPYLLSRLPRVCHHNLHSINLNKGDYAEIDNRFFFKPKEGLLHIFYEK